VSVLTCALGPDAAGTVLMRLFTGARRSIDAAIYEVGPSYRWALVRAVERGLRVRLVLDAHRSDGNAATARELSAAGAECRVAGVGADAAHGKLLLVDGTLAVGTGNLIWRDAPRDAHLRMPPHGLPLSGTREWWVTVAGSRRLHDRAAEAFAAHWLAARSMPSGWGEASQVAMPAVGTPVP
jgi:phosphatidylserine/phosphatidylglycerophosphate/cardiolipin synthase-like enzyme